MNTILNPDRTRKNIVSVDEATARSPECPIDILPTDIFVENAPLIPEGLILPSLLPDNSAWIEGASTTEIAARDAAVVEQAFSDMEERLERYTEEVARQRRYRMDTLQLWANSVNPTFATEAQTYLSWYESFWTAAAQVEADVRAGTRTAPTYDELILELPQIVWP